MTLEELLRQGKSFGQGASNAAASTVTGPVDMLAWLLRKGGVDVGDAPIGGEAWMRQKGLMATPENRLAGLLGEGAGLAAPIVAAAKAPEIAGGLLQMGRNLATPQTMNKQTGAIVYHGSPHKFDKFDSSKIGTGEGAQAYGHGLYLAESPDVAKSYQTTLTMDRGFNFGGKSGLTREQLQDLVNAREGGKYLDGVTKPSGVADQVIDSIVYGKNGELPRSYKAGSERAALFEKLKQEIAHTDQGALYKVDLPDEHIAKMLDWDKPLLEQQSLLKSVPEFAEANQAVFGHPISTSEPLADMAYQTLSKHLGGADKAADLLRKRGIPGIRYLDGGSRGAGAGSSNFVVFPGNEGLLKILERNGGKP